MGFSQIISARGEDKAPKTSSTPPSFIEVPVLSLASERSCICALVVSMLSLFAIYLLDFRTVLPCRIKIECTLFFVLSLSLILLFLIAFSIL